MVKLTGDALVFWKMNKMLNFQNARRFAVDEVAVPYLNNRKTGFCHYKTSMKPKA